MRVPLACLLAIIPLTNVPVLAEGTLEQYLSVPFASQMSASPSGGKVAWVIDQQGARNIWVAEAPDYAGRRLTAYTEDDGHEIGHLTWAPDGSFLAYARGGDLSERAPNPTNQAVEQPVTVFKIAFAGGAPQEVRAGHSPAVAPDGRIAFLSGGNIWMTDSAGREAALTVRTRGAASQLTWSPDGSRLAFTDGRGDHSFIGVYDAASEGVTYLDPSVDSDSDPVWSPDGRSIAFLRQAYSSRLDVGPYREAATPFSIRIANPGDGSGVLAWRALPGAGSAFRGVQAERQISWTADDRIVFPWEAGGWLRLYSIPTNIEAGGIEAGGIEAGGLFDPATGSGRTAQQPLAPDARLLTPCECEVDHVTLSLDRRDVLYSSNQSDRDAADIDRRHLWRVPASGNAAPVPLIGPPGDSIEWQPAEPGNQTIAYLTSSATVFPQAAIKIANRPARPLAPDAVPPNPPTGLVIPQPVVFPASDGLQLHGQLFLPQRADAPQRHPAVVFFHGGSRRQMMLGYHYMQYYANAYSLNQYLASQGFVVLSVNYRSGIGYGLNFRETLNFGNAGGSEFNDVKGAGDYLAARDDVDPARIAAWGGSYGGYLTGLALARASNLYRAGVDIHGVHDWSVRPDRVLNAANIDELREIEATALASSPLADISGWTSPVLLIHGDDDRNVTFSQTERMVEALRAQGVPFEQLIFPGEIHEFLLHRTWLRAYEAAAEFLKRQLADKP